MSKAMEPVEDEKSKIGKKGNWADELATLKRRQIISDLYLQGKPQWQIAEMTSVSQSQVSRDLQWCVEQWQETIVDKVDRHRAIELAKLNKIEQEAWRMWDRSCKAVKIDKKLVKKGKKIVEEEVESVVETTGDDRWLARIDRCIEHRIKLLGLAPKEEKNQVNIYNIDFDKLVNPIPSDDPEDPVRKRLAQIESITTVPTESEPSDEQAS